MISPAGYIDHTLLKAVATRGDIQRLCEEAVEYGFAAVCIPPVYVPLAAERLYGSEVTTGTVVGFPLGYQAAAQKAAEAAAAVAAGAGEIDMVIHLGAVFENRLEAVADEIRQVVTAARGAEVKVIIECCYLDQAQKRALVECVVAGGAAFVKTSTGFGSGGATAGRRPAAGRGCGRTRPGQGGRRHPRLGFLPGIAGGRRRPHRHQRRHRHRRGLAQRRRGSMSRCFRRAVLIILDGVGIGALPDAAAYGDARGQHPGPCGRRLRRPATAAPAGPGPGQPA